MYREEHWNILQSMLKGTITDIFLNNLIEEVVKNNSGRIKKYKKGSKFYRAREFSYTYKENNPTFEGYNEIDSLAPKPELVKEPGRVNKIGESVLYIAENKYTAMAEIRPGRRQPVSIAEIEILKDIKVFEFEYIDCGGYDTPLKNIYHDMAMNFYMSVNYDKETEYLATQYIAKKIQELQFDGIKYSSSLSETGMNLAIFNPELAKANNSKLFLNQSVLFLAFKQSIYSNDFERLIPKKINESFNHEEIECFFNRMK